jgi:hypothetical protein
MVGHVTHACSESFCVNLCPQSQPRVHCRHEGRPGVVAAILILVASLAIIAVMIAVMIALDRIHRRRIQQRREAWKAAGGIGPCPGDTRGGSGGHMTGNYG